MGLPPLTAADADRLIGSAQAASPGGDGVDRDGVRDLLLRVSQLADDLPEVAALEVGPVTAGLSGAVIADARVKVVLRPPRDPLLRRLR
jgi:ATP-grasp domain